MVAIDRERLISEKQNKASAEGARLPKEAMLLRDIFKFYKAHPWTRFVLLDSSAGLSKGQEVPPIALTFTFIKQSNTKHKTYVPFAFERGSF